MSKSIFAASAAILALTLAGCGPKAENTADAVANSASNAADAAGAMASNASVDVEQALTATPNGQEFVNRAARTDAYEIEAAKLAQANGASADVKAFAADMIKAHTESTAKIKAAAAKATPVIVPDPALTADQSKDLADLAKKKGAEFDEAYVDAQVDAHQTALAMMRDYAEKGDTPTLKAVAGEIAPIVQAHLDHAKSLDK